MADDADTPCDYTTITRLSIHNYDCHEDFVTTTFSPGGPFFKKIAKQLNGYGGVNWKSWFKHMPIWLTETNCSYENGVATNFSNVESCQRITGQVEEYGRGSIYAWTSLEQVERVFWWTTSTSGNQLKAGASMMSPTNELYPVGRAFVNNFDAEATDCTAAPQNNYVAN